MSSFRVFSVFRGFFRGIGFQPIVFGTVFAVSSNARLAACLPAEFASRIWYVAKPVMLDVLVHDEDGSQ